MTTESGESAPSVLAMTAPTVKRCGETRAHYAHEWYNPLRQNCPGGPDEAPKHGLAWENKRNIICLCGQVCAAVIKRSPAPLMGTTSDEYEARPAAQAFANHLWKMNHPDAAADTETAP